jgi:3-oxoacyl-[acyl-carrier protein] reductase
MNIDLSGKIALVTGASGELGRVIARTLAECGADVAVHYHHGEDRAARVEREIRALGRRSMIASAEITSPEGVAALKSAIVGELGHPDIVVLNAVIQYDWKPVLDQSPADYEGQFRSCVLQAVLLAQSFVPSMVKRKQGRFIAINTECSIQCTPSQSAYVSGKRGMDGVLRVLAREIGPSGVTVNQVAPGWMISGPGYEKNVPLRHRGEDKDIANAVAFLASDCARFITGAFLPVCGGNVMVGI